MKKYEYKIVRQPMKVSMFGGSSLGTEADTALNKLGEEGWELIGVVPQVGGISDTIGMFLYFKREID